MKQLLILVAATYFTQLKADQKGLKILGGDFAAKDQFPHLVALLYNGWLRCGGNIVAPKWIFTAAQCVDDNL